MISQMRFCCSKSQRSLFSTFSLTLVTVDSPPVHVTFAGPIALQSLVALSVLAFALWADNTWRWRWGWRWQIMCWLMKRTEPWSQWTPYLPLWQVSQAVPLKPSLHRHTPVPFVPSTHTPLSKQGRPFGPGHASQCSPKNPAQHLRSWKHRRVLVCHTAEDAYPEMSRKRTIFFWRQVALQPTLGSHSPSNVRVNMHFLVLLTDFCTEQNTNFLLWL